MECGDLNWNVWMWGEQFCGIAIGPNITCDRKKQNVGKENVVQGDKDREFRE